jgi:hypothetical protein
MLSPSYSISPKDLWNAIATRRSSSMCAGAMPTSNRHACYLVQSGVMRAKPSIGLHAVPLGLSALAGDDDHGLLERGFMVYDALFAWLRLLPRNDTTGRPRPRNKHGNH